MNFDKIRVIAAALSLFIIVSCKRNNSENSPEVDEPKQDNSAKKEYGVYENIVLPSGSSGLLALSDSALMVALKEPISSFEEMLTLTPFLLRDASGDDLTPQKYSGAFKVASTENGVVTLEKNGNYYDKGNVKPKKINIETINNITDCINKMSAGDIQIASDIPADDAKSIPELKNRNDFCAKPLSETVFLQWHLDAVEPPFDDLLVRKALSLAIDRRALSETIGDYMPASGIVPYGAIEPNGVDFRDNDAKTLDSPAYVSDNNLYEASALLDFSGISLKTLTINLLYDENSVLSKSVAEFLENSWSNLGVKMNLARDDKYVKRGDITVSIKNVKNPSKDPMYILKPLRFYCNNAEAGKLIDEAGTDTESRFRVLHKAEKILENDFSAIPLLFRTKSYLANSDVVKDYFVDADGIKHCSSVNLPTLSVSADSDGTADLVVAQTCAGLFRRNQQGRIEPELAKNFTVSEDGLVYVFYLRENQKWSNGTPITAADFVNSWNKQAQTDIVFTAIKGY